MSHAALATLWMRCHANWDRIAAVLGRCAGGYTCSLVTRLRLIDLLLLTCVLEVIILVAGLSGDELIAQFPIVYLVGELAEGTLAFKRFMS